jgi:hypothetical protein
MIFLQMFLAIVFGLRIWGQEFDSLRARHFSLEIKYSRAPALSNLSKKSVVLAGAEFGCFGT